MPTTIFEILIQDHRNVNEILTEIQDTSQTQEKKKLFKKFKDEMINHSVSEEKAVYNPLKDKNENEYLVLEAIEEHDLVTQLIKQLSKLSPSLKKWDAKLKVLKDLIEHHVDEEENEMFEKIKKSFTEEELISMASNMNDLKNRKGAGQPKKTFINAKIKNKKTNTRKNSKPAKKKSSKK